MASPDYDLLIAGGGLVGSSLALALAAYPLRIGIIEPAPPPAQGPPRADSRALALAFGSCRIFESMGCWSGVVSKATPIRRIHVSDRGHFGVTRMDAAQAALPALGYVAEAQALGQALYRRLADSPRIDFINPAHVVNIAAETTQVRVQIADPVRTLTARLLVGADGSRSLVRQLLCLPTRQADYDQTAIIANVTTERPHQYTAFERFTDTGPLALLPFGQTRANLIWSVRHTQSPYLTAVDEATFLSLLQQRFGWRLGRFTQVGRRHTYPLRLLRAEQSGRHRALLIGNAAHTLHPVAGQGLNVGLRDVAALAQILADAHKAGRDPGSPATLSAYTRWRHRDQRLVTGFTDTLVRLFSNDSILLGPARDLGLTALDILPPVKRRLMRHAMGLAGRQSRLARGLPL